MRRLSVCLILAAALPLCGPAGAQDASIRAIMAACPISESFYAMAARDGASRGDIDNYFHDTAASLVGRPRSQSDLAEMARTVNEGAPELNGLLRCQINARIAQLNGTLASRPQISAPPAQARPPGPSQGTAGDASEEANCVSLYRDANGLAGGFENRCGFRVQLAYCAYRPAQGASSGAFNCETKPGGRTGVAAHGRAGALVSQAEQVYWFYCQDPVTPSGVRFEAGKMVGVCK